MTVAWQHPSFLAPASVLPHAARMKELPQSSSCFACGKDHPTGLGLAFSKHGELVQCTWVPRGDQAGFNHAVHGGLTATVLDEAMAWACGILGGRFAYSAEMTVRYHKLLAPNTVTICQAEIESASSRLLKTRATLTAGDEVVASATGKYFPIHQFTEAAVRLEFGDGANEILPYLTMP